MEQHQQNDITENGRWLKTDIIDQTESICIQMEQTANDKPRGLILRLKAERIVTGALAIGLINEPDRTGHLTPADIDGAVALTIADIIEMDA